MLASACGNVGDAPGEPPPSSGIAGVTVVDEGCPVLEAESSCGVLPLEARVFVRRSGSHQLVATVTSDEQGRFRVLVPPGRYELQGENLSGAPVPTAMPVEVIVPEGDYATTTVRFDSGVRGAPLGG